MTITITIAANVEYTIATEKPRRSAQPVEAAHDRVEQQRDQRRDQEQDHGMTRRGRQHPAEQDEQRQPDELDPARNLDPRRRAGGSVHAIDRTTGPPQRPRRAPVWDWGAGRGRVARARPAGGLGRPAHETPASAGTRYAVEGPSGVRYGPADVAAPGLRARLASACPSPSARSAAASACRARRGRCRDRADRARDRVRRRWRIGGRAHDTAERVAPASGRAAAAAGRSRGSARSTCSCRSTRAASPRSATRAAPSARSRSRPSARRRTRG